MACKMALPASEKRQHLDQPEQMNLQTGVDPDEVAHNELPHLDLHCLPFGPCNLCIT